MKLKIVLALAALIGASGSAVAAEWIVGDAMAAKSGDGLVVPVGFEGDGVISDAMVDLRYDASQFSAAAEAVNGASCVVHPKGGIVRVITPDAGSVPLAKGMNVFCNIRFSPVGAAKNAKPSISVDRADCSKPDATLVACGSEAATL